jgi:hypothetical protein
MTNQTTTTETPAVTPPPLPLPDPDALREKTRACRAELHGAKTTSLLRGLCSLEEEKVALRADVQPTGFEGAGRPGGPTPGDRYAAYLRPALAAITALDRYETTIAAAETVSVALAGAFAQLDGALRTAEGESDEILDAGRVEHLLHLRRQLEAARLEHAGLADDLENARPLRRSFSEKAARLRDAGVAVLYEQLVNDRRAALARLRQHWEVLHASGVEETVAVRDLAARWEARLGQPVPLPVLRWPGKGGPFDPPVLEEAEG